MKALALVNSSGGSAGEDSAGKVAAALAAAGIAAGVEAVAPGGLAERAAAAVDAGCDLVIAAGGDGTIGAVAGALAGRDATLGVLPLGTLNHFARDLGISFDLAKAAQVIASGRVRTIDLASVNGRIFVNNSALGLYPLMVSDREVQQQRLGRSKRLAMLVAGVRTLARMQHHRLALTVNDEGKRPIDTPLLFVGNNDYRLDASAPGQRDSIADGQLCVIALRRMGRLGLFAALVRALAGRSREGDMIRLGPPSHEIVTRLRVASRRRLLTISCDGETLRLPPPLDYAILPGALRVVAPL